MAGGSSTAGASSSSSSRSEANTSCTNLRLHSLAHLHADRVNVQAEGLDTLLDDLLQQGLGGQWWGLAVLPHDQTGPFDNFGADPGSRSPYESQKSWRRPSCHDAESRKKGKGWRSL